MARSATGKWVARAASTGGGRTYRGQVPANWYAGLILIVLIGFGSVVYPRYEYQHPTSAKVIQPAVGTTTISAISYNICGKEQAPISAAAAHTGLYSPGSGVITIAPTSSSNAGNNATLANFAKNQGLVLLQHELVYPGTTQILTDGSACAKGTPDAGKKAYVQFKYFPAFTINKGSLVSGGPSAIKLGNRSYVAVGFVPKGTALKRNPTIEVAELQSSAALASGSAGTTATTAPVTPSTTATTTKSSSTASSTTTAPPTSSSTTTPSSTTSTTVK